jgi:hypothetical protein
MVAIYMSALCRLFCVDVCRRNVSIRLGLFPGLLEVIHWAGRGESVESRGTCTNHQLAPQCKSWRPIITD